MTAILAYQEGKSAWMGGDSEITLGDVVVISPDPKIWKPRPGVLIGAAGGLAWCDAVAWLHWPEPRSLNDAWVRQGLVPAICRQLTEAERQDGEALLFACGHIYRIEAGGAFRIRDKWHGIGCGGTSAMVACAAASHLSGPIRVRRALELTGRYMTGVGPPYKVLKA